MMIVAVLCYEQLCCAVLKALEQQMAHNLTTDDRYPTTTEFATLKTLPPIVNARVPLIALPFSVARTQ